MATSPGNGQHPTLYLLLGGAVLLMALMLLIGQGWARHVLGVLGVVAVIFFAVGGGSWQAIVSFVLLAAGADAAAELPRQCTISVTDRSVHPPRLHPIEVTAAECGPAPRDSPTSPGAHLMSGPEPGRTVHQRANR